MNDSQCIHSKQKNGGQGDKLGEEGRQVERAGGGDTVLPAWAFAQHLISWSNLPNKCGHKSHSGPGT